MSKVFLNQTKLIIRLDLQEDITGHSVCQIRYRKPSGTQGFFPATVESAILGLISYEVINSSDLDQAGQWTFWGHVLFLDNKTIAGESTKIQVFKEGFDS